MAIISLDDLQQQTQQDNQPNIISLDELQKKVAPVDVVHDGTLKDKFDAMKSDTNNVIDTLSTGIPKLLTGKTLFDQKQQVIPQATEKPYDSNVIKARNPINQFNQVGSQAAAGAVDELATPINIALGLEKPAANLAGNVSKTVMNLKNNIADKVLNPEFKITSQMDKYGHNPKEPLKSMPDMVGSDLISTQAAVNNKISETGQAISDTMQNHPNANVKIDATQAVTKPFDDAIAKLNVQDPLGNEAVIKRLTQAKQSLQNVSDESGKVTGIYPLDNMTPNELWQYRQKKIDPQTKFSGNPSDDKIVNAAYQDARHNVKQLINQNIPEVAPLNKDYGNLLATSDSLDKAQLKADNAPLDGIRLQDILSVGVNRFLEDPNNKIKFARWLYTAPKPEIKQAMQQVPNIQQAILKNFGGTQIGTATTTPRVIPQSKGIMTKTLGAGAVATGLAANQADAQDTKPLVGEASTYGWGEKLNPIRFDQKPFNPQESFVAMRNVPMGTKVRITDTKTGKTLDTTVQDGGPAQKTHRVVDLSQGAWRKLGYNQPGLTNVKVDILERGTGRSYPHIIRHK